MRQSSECSGTVSAPGLEHRRNTEAQSDVQDDSSPALQGTPSCCMHSPTLEGTQQLMAALTGGSAESRCTSEMEPACGTFFPDPAEPSVCHTTLLSAHVTAAS